MALLLTALGAAMALSAPLTASTITYFQTETAYFVKADNVDSAARAPPLAEANVAITGGVAVRHGSAFTVHGQETVAALFGFGVDLNAPNTTTISSPLPNGQPGAIWRGFGEPNARQQGLLDQLQSPGDTIIIPKSGISQQDLAALTAATGDEFAVFTTGGRRMVVRGGADNFGGIIDESWAAARAAEGWRFSAHTHPIPESVNPSVVMRSSEGDRAILDLFDNENSAIMGSNGAMRLFNSVGDW